MGDVITASLLKDEVKKEIEMPAYMEKELKKYRSAYDHFSSLPPSHKKEYIKWIEEAKKDETRNNRIAKAIEMLSQGRKLK